MQAVWQSQVFQGLFKRIFANNQYEHIFNIIRIMFNLIKMKESVRQSGVKVRKILRTPTLRARIFVFL